MLKFIVAIALLVSILIITGCTNKKGSTSAKNKETNTQNTNTEEASSLIEENKDNSDFIILDVRTSEEFQEGHIKNATNFDYYSNSFQENLNNLSKTKNYLVYCKSGSRSGKTLNLMEELNFEKVYNMQGGITSWKNNNYPTTK
ncbi:MAG: rhodanese-like domain-containing protein [Parcubacteria group bacterium]|nr:rhodanese-like domain-containing protein [Parcubacteria group bacterium]